MLQIQKIGTQSLSGYRSSRCVGYSAFLAFLVCVPYTHLTPQTLDTVHTSFPRPMAPYLKDFLSASLHHLQVLLPTFTHFYLSSSASPPGSSEDEPVGIPLLICPLMDFVTSATRGGKARDWFDQENLLGLIESLFNFLQMTEEDVSIYIYIYISFLTEMTSLLVFRRRLGPQTLMLS